ncbi:carbohydrate kinase family protein [Georgenia thermotolerans]|uniref:Carbohydrate kinase n=1 Tax=Georgenia thermotolerans TaxID=527326 RepID=A0A7J5UTS2_9MICO|nr:carbohydrate kinase [Georgenia thermotolerans]KAE8765660.1 carbohydrate kinase [Georgenia thermotolerans]
MTEVLVVGESLVDIVRAAGAEPSHRPGGSPLNVAVGVARLGVPAALHTRIGSDSHGRAILDHLRASGVELTAASMVNGHTSTARADIDPDGAAKYEFDLDVSLAPVDEAARDVRWIHAGSIAAVLEPGASRVRRAFDDSSAGVVRSFDPNIRPDVVGDPRDHRAAVEWYVSRSDVVKASDEDAELLYPDRDPRETLRAWLAGGARLAVLTCGEDGAHAVFEGGEMAAPAARVNVRDTIGAGDAFMAALIWRLLARVGRNGLRVDEDTMADAVGGALACAGVTVGREGADPPRLGEVPSW